MRSVLLIGMAVMVMLAGCAGPLGGGDSTDEQMGNGNGNGFSAGNGNGASADVASGNGNGASAGDGNGEQVGYSVGGASDINNFRDNVQEGFLPIASDVTTEGVYKEYYFDTGADGPCEKLFCPSYSQAVSEDPISSRTEQYLTVGLNSGIEKSDLERPDLNLVVVVDESGSMGSPFDQYYYDEDGNRVETEKRRKMAAAKDAVGTLLDQLDGSDRVGIVSFADTAQTVAGMERVDEREMRSVREAVDDLSEGGGTNLDAAMERAESMAAEYADEDDRETRIVYVTDAMPNREGTSTEILGGQLESHAERDIHSTFVGVGVDFNTELIDAITGIRGANYYSVNSAAQFQARMNDGFDYMVTPLVFDLSLSVEADGYEIDQVYGTTAENALDGDIMHVETLFPSKTEGGRTKGGVILLELEDTGPGDTVEIEVSYESRDGESHATADVVEFQDHEPESFENDGIRKAVALARYAELTGNWISYERARLAGEDPDDPEGSIERREDPDLGEWERQSTELRVSPVYRDRFEAFAEYFESEREAIGDEPLGEELEILEQLLAAGAKQSNETEDAGRLSPAPVPGGAGVGVSGP